MARFAHADELHDALGIGVGRKRQVLHLQAYIDNGLSVELNLGSRRHRGLRAPGPAPVSWNTHGRRSGRHSPHLFLACENLGADGPSDAIAGHNDHVAFVPRPLFEHVQRRACCIVPHDRRGSVGRRGPPARPSEQRSAGGVTVAAHPDAPAWSMPGDAKSTIGSGLSAYERSNGWM